MSSSTPQRVAVLGSSFAGMTAALEVRKHLDERHGVGDLELKPVSSRTTPHVTNLVYRR